MNNNEITVLFLNEIDKFDTNKKGKFLFLFGSFFNFDFHYNLIKIINNFKYIIFSNQDKKFISSVIPDFDIFVSKQNLEEITNVFDIKENKVIKFDSLGFVFYNKPNFAIKKNYSIPNSNNEKILSFILDEKFIFPLYLKEILLNIGFCFINYFHVFQWNDLNNNDEKEILYGILILVKSQISSLIANDKIPDWAINYSKEAQDIQLQINNKNIEIERLKYDIKNLKIQSNKLILENNFLWTDSTELEESLEKIINKIFTNWTKLKKIDNEDLLFKNANDIFIFEVKGTVKNINEGYITQLAKYIPTIEEKYPDSEYNLFPILFINNQKDINPTARKFQYAKPLENRVLKRNISVVTSLRLYNLLQEKNYKQIEEDFKTAGLHYE